MNKEAIIEFLNKNESKPEFDEFAKYLIANKKSLNLRWQDMSDLSKEFYNINKSEAYFRRKSKKDNIVPTSLPIEARLEAAKEKVQLSDERNQLRAYIRKLARQDYYKEAVIKAVEEISSRKQLSPFIEVPECFGDNEAILCLSDWHYGIECNNYWNIYNEEVAKRRITFLRNKVIDIGIKNKVNTLHIFNLGDMIAGLIHLTLRLESRSDVVTQTMRVSELLAEFITDLSQYFVLKYYSCLDNHSRITPNKDDSLDNESLARIIDWYLEKRCPNLLIHINEYGEDIIDALIKNWKVLGVHGHHDNPKTAISTLSSYTEENYDLILTAHKHHFLADENCGTLLIGNGSLMGTDTYAQNLRLASPPSQNLIIVSDDNVCEALYRIVLE